MHEPGAHRLGPAKPRELTREIAGEFTQIIYTNERVCEECGEPALEAAKVKRPAYLVRTATRERLVQIEDPHRKLARILEKKWRSDAGWMPLKGSYTLMLPLAAWQVEPLLDDLCLTGSIDLRSAPVGGPPTHFRVTQPGILAELANPGDAANRTRAKAHANEIMGKAENSEAVRVRQLLASAAADDWPPEALMSAAAVARHAGERRTLPVRVVSTVLLGGRVTEVSASKAIERYGDRLESFFGKPLSALGMRPHEPLVTIGGQGKLHEDQALDLARHFPFIAFPATRLTRVELVEFPAAGVVFIENRNVFEAACYGEIPDLAGSLFVFTGGMVGSSEEWFARVAADVGAKVRCWFDLDGEGILAARLVRGWTHDQCEPYRMGTREVSTARRWEPLTGAKLSTMRRIAEDGGFLSELAAALLQEKRWIEQEALLLVEP